MEMDILNDIKSLIKSRRHCVMATVNKTQPYCSLMTYITDEKVSCVYMVTHRNSRKFANLNTNPQVSLLIDTREKKQSQAMTVMGLFRELNTPSEAEKIRENFFNDHPHMKTFIDHPESTVICIQIKSVLLLNGLEDAHYVEFG